LKQTRLIIERLVKQRFYASRVGVTFRNSKWVNYEKKNSYVTQSNLVSWLYFIILFILLPVTVSSLLFGVEYTLNQSILLESKIKLLFASIISYATLFSTFLKTKLLNNFVQSRFGFNDKFVRIPNSVGHTNDNSVETFSSHQSSNYMKNYIDLEDYIITLEKANMVASYLRLLEDQSVIKHVKRLSRAPLVSYYHLPGTSENCDI
jgi:hypothetical protein